jgi:hypothetical protein
MKLSVGGKGKSVLFWFTRAELKTARSHDSKGATKELADNGSRKNMKWMARLSMEASDHTARTVRLYSI